MPWRQRHGAAAIAAAADHEENCSLYFGLAGVAVALEAVHDQLGDSSAGRAARRALARVRSRFDGQRWGVMFELLGGNAGIALPVRSQRPGWRGCPVRVFRLWVPEIPSMPLTRNVRE